MEEQGVGWLAAIIIGGIAGWLAEKFMKSDMGIIMNIILGIVGAVVAQCHFGPTSALRLVAGLVISSPDLSALVILIWVGRLIRR